MASIPHRKTWKSWILYDILGYHYLWWARWLIVCLFFAAGSYLGYSCCGACSAAAFVFFFLDCFQDWVGDHLEFQRLVEEFAPRDFDTVYFAANCVLMPSNSLVYVHVIFSNHCLGVDVILVRRFRCQFETR